MFIKKIVVQQKMEISNLEEYGEEIAKNISDNLAFGVELAS